MRYSHLAFVLLAAGCGHRQPRPGIDTPVGHGYLNETPPLKPSDPVWIWSGGKAEKWRAVVITPASVSGIPYGTALKCDSCRRSIPRAQVDSMKLAPKGVGRTALEGAGALAAVILLEIVVCTAVGVKNGC
jgi:hypothetical protein